MLMTYYRMRCVLCPPQTMFAELSESGNSLEVASERLASVATELPVCLENNPKPYFLTSRTVDFMSTSVDLLVIIGHGQNLVLQMSYHKSPCDVGKPGARWTMACGIGMCRTCFLLLAALRIWPTACLY